MFIGHGNPMNAIEDNRYTKKWREMGKQLPRPQAILSISAHWLSRNGAKVTMMDKPKTIHDFRGFPQELFEQDYPAAGAPEYAKETQRLITSTGVAEDFGWGLDHGTWSVLVPMYPLADIPVYQLSIDYGKPPEYHYEIGQQLRALREKGVLIIGSGNLVHNLGVMQFHAEPYDWAVEFDKKMEEWMRSGDHRSIMNLDSMGELARLAHPTRDHFYPLLYVLGLQEPKDKLEFFNEGIDLGSVSMRSALLK